MKDVVIQGTKLSGHVVLGPMAGITSLAYREFMKPFGVALSFSEMISDCGLDYGNAKTAEYYQTSSLDRPIGLQLFGFDVEHTKNAIRVLEKNADYDFLDINLGCPVHKVVRTGAGSAWLQRPEAMYEYVREIVKFSSRPVTAKIRIGWDENSIIPAKLASLLQNAGVSMLTIHARTSRQMYTGKANYEAIRGLGKMLTIPLCVSGDIYTPTDALNAMKIADADLVMVARGGVGNPQLITNIERAIEGKDLLPDPTLLQQAEWAESYANGLIHQYGEKTALMLLRGILPKFFSGFPGYKRVRNQIATHLATKEDLDCILCGI